VGCDLRFADLRTADLTEADFTGATWCDGSTCLAGSKGECETGVRFSDNCDGTISDADTGLMCEKKTGTVGQPVTCDSTDTCPDPHDVNNTYTWSSTGVDFDGTASTVFRAQLNDVAGGGTNCFAGHCDWMLPQVDRDGGTAELETILDLSEGRCGGGNGACIDPIFSPISVNAYWSSTTIADFTDIAWVVGFDGAAVPGGFKNGSLFARAVRPCL